MFVWWRPWILNIQFFFCVVLLSFVLDKPLVFGGEKSPFGIFFWRGEFLGAAFVSIFYPGLGWIGSQSIILESEQRRMYSGEEAG